VRAAGDLAARVYAFERRLGVRVDHETAVLVVEDRVRIDLFPERVDPGAAIAAKHVGQRDVRVALRDAGRVEVPGRPTVGRRDAVSFLDLVEDRLADRVPRTERIG